jgi:hypothetical protein
VVGSIGGCGGGVRAAAMRSVSTVSVMAPIEGEERGEGSDAQRTGVQNARGSIGGSQSMRAGNTIASRPSRRQIREAVFNGPLVIAPVWSNPARRISGREPN